MNGDGTKKAAADCGGKGVICLALRAALVQEDDK